MELLCSNFPPVKTQNADFADTFYSFLPQADSLNIAVGYITADSLIELQKAVELNHVNQLNLIIDLCDKHPTLGNNLKGMVRAQEELESLR